MFSNLDKSEHTLFLVLVVEELVLIEHEGSLFELFRIEIFLCQCPLSLIGF
jgi:hypothetical protein